MDTDRYKGKNVCRRVIQRSKSVDSKCQRNRYSTKNKQTQNKTKQKHHKTNQHPKDLGDCDNSFDNGCFARPVVSREIINYIHGDGPPNRIQEGRW